ncbi:MAG: LCP family protein [Bacilli bacterium]|nr:LCP family protein [Bacilli bacterium]
MTKNTRKKQIIKNVSRVIVGLSLIIFAIFVYYLSKMNVVPSKYFYPAVIVLCLIEFICLFFAIYKKTKTKLLIGLDVLLIIMMVIEAFASVRLHQTLDFLYNGLHVKTTTDVYYVVANKEAKYNSLESIENHKLYYFNDLDEIEEFKTQVLEIVKVDLVEVENYYELFSNILIDKERLILINSINYDTLLENEEAYNGKLKVVGEIEYLNEVEIEPTKETGITSEPFTIYLSGIDTRGSGMPSRSLSDVNMFIVVNPKTRTILLVNVPRDYLVQLHGKNGKKDKLTHAGVIGGVALSKSTVEDIVGMEADYYARVNFKAVINLVDAVGGITINSDVNYNIKCWTDQGCIIHPGNNNVGGRCALAFARERHAYKTGDEHRAENQQQVMKLLLDKIASTNTLLNNFGSILDSLKGTFDTNISTENIQELIQFQINDMRGWNVITSNMVGEGGMSETYSYPETKLSVVYPDEKSIEDAKAKIKEVLEAK